MTGVVSALLLSWATDLPASPLFEEDTVLDVTLRGPVSSVIVDTEDRAERDFVIGFDSDEYPVKMRVRGNSRVRVCEFPPLRLNFRHADVAQTAFDGQDKLKLVTHCRNQDRAEQDLLEEYAAYRIFNVLTDTSFRVRPLHMSYVDTDGKLKEKGAHRFAFVLETVEQLAARMGAQPVTMEGVPKRRHDLEQAALVYVYQYLIANTDWGLVKADYDEGCCHNIELFELDDIVVFVPYDLDLSGLVNARYAFPDRTLRIKRVTQRLYRGLCTDRSILGAALDEVIGRETEITEVLQDTPGLTDDNREKAIRFVGRFFERAADREDLLDSFERRCVE